MPRTIEQNIAERLDRVYEELNQIREYYHGHFRGAVAADITRKLWKRSRALGATLAVRRVAGARTDPMSATPSIHVPPQVEE
jgi:Arc/MetJ family transcription regulator